MNEQSNSPEPSPGEPVRMLEFSSGGWAILLAVILCAGAAVWHLRFEFPTPGSLKPGDGRHVETYGFDLAICTIPREQLVAAGMPKDGVPALSHPPVLSVADVENLNERQRGQYLVPSDRVIGVVISGQARAYPLRVMNWHEVINDTILETPLLVTYSPFCDSPAVYRRVVNGETVEFGVSGLMFNSNPLLFDRRANGAGESLWSQLLGEAVAGPAAAAGWKLERIPCYLMGYGDWVNEHPGTTVLAPDPRYKDLYKKNFGNYFGSDVLRFPVSPLPPAPDLPKKTPVIVIRAGGESRAFTYDAIRGRVDTKAGWATAIGDTPVTFRYYPHPPAVIAASNDSSKSVEVIYAFWFAWYALQPDTELAR
ncbi:MAG TPA: DUF3179 domain-containing (seleno)protein [bacterium]|nr:DUF3179 domain-containing protein [Candidatus Omnitrophota bacterium]HOL96556.1 DUF3179 domain-containing (seleno)protein [bacterium]